VIVVISVWHWVVNSRVINCCVTYVHPNETAAAVHKLMRSVDKLSGAVLWWLTAAHKCC